MKTKGILMLAIAGVLLQSCSRDVYNNNTYIASNATAGHTVAILPVEVDLTGRLPKGYTRENELRDEENESIAIQNMIYSEYLFKAKSTNKKKASVKLMNTELVNSKLKENGINTRQSWEMNPDSLGKLLGADLVLKIRVQKRRVMSETASLGIGVATTVLDRVLDKSTGSSNSTLINTGAKTYSIVLNGTLSDVKTHTVVSKITKEQDADWKRSPEEVLKSTSAKLVRKGAVYAQQ